MGINAAFSSWLQGAKSFVSSGIRAAQTFGTALQAQTLTALNTAQRAVTQPFQPQQTQQRSATPNPYTARTITPATIVGEAGRAISGGVQAAQRAADPIVRAHAPIVQGIQRDIGRIASAAPAAFQNAPAMFQSGVQQLSRAHAPIMQGVQRDAGSAIRPVPGALAGSGRAVSGGAQQIVQAHAPIMQGLQRDTGRAIRSISGANPFRQAAPRQAPQSRIVGSNSPTPTSTSQGRVQQATGARGQAGPAPTPQQRYAQYTQDVQRYQNNPAHTRLPQLIAQHETAVKQYGIDPQLRQYEQKLSAYNAQVNAVGPNPSRAQAETVARLQSMQRELEGMRTSIDARKRQELAEIRMLEANIKMLGTPLQVEYQRLQAEEQALFPASSPDAGGSQQQVSPRITYGPGGGAGGRGESATVKAPRVQRTDPLSIAGGVAQYLLATPDRTKPLFDWGQDAGQWWTKNAAPAIEKVIDTAPYLGPKTIPQFRPGPSGVGGRSGDQKTLSPGTSRGEIAYTPASPLTGGGTRLKPNWQGDFGHDALKGLAVDTPQHTLEFVTAVPLGLERFGGALQKDPGAAMTTLAGGFGMVAGGITTAAKENPGRFTGELVGSALLGRAGSAAYAKGVKPAMITAGEATGIVRKQTYGFGGKAHTNPVQYMSRAESLETILENPTISGVRAASAPVGAFARDAGLIPTRKMQIRNPAAIGDVPAGQSVSAEGVFMALSRPGLIEPYGTWFTKGGTKRGGIKGKVLGSRVYLHENVRTVQIPKALKDRIYQRVRETGEFWGDDYDAVLKLAKEQSKQYGEPVAVPSPKRAIGDWKPENEAFLVFADDVSRKITGTKFAGLSSEGTIVKRISMGQQPPIPQTRLGSVAENIRYNWDLGRDGLRIYNRRYLEAQTKDMTRKKGELYENFLSYPGEYAGHGLGHAQGVQSGQVWQRSVSPTLQQAATPSEMWLRAKYHDIAKIGDADTQPYPHGWAAGTAIKKGLIQDPDLLSLPKETQKAIGRDIQLHTDIQPTVLSKIRYRPSATAKALATADRLDLARFGVPVKSSKLFPIPEETIGFKVGQVADRLPIGFQVRFVDAPAPLSGGAAVTARSSSASTRSLAPTKAPTPTPATATPKGGERLDYSYSNPGKPAVNPPLIPPVKEYGYPSRTYEGPPYVAPYGEKYPQYKEPYVALYGTQYLEPAPPYKAPYSEPYAAAPYSTPYAEPYVAPPYSGPYAPPYPGPYGTPYAPPYPGTYPPTPARPRSPPYTAYSKPPAGAPAPRAPQKEARKVGKRRRKRPGELDHWEIGPAPGLAEMHGLIFGPPDRSPLDLGPPGLSVLNLGAAPAPGGQSSFGFAARGPARPPVIPSFGPPAKAPGKKPAHAGKTPAKKNQGILNDKPRSTTQKNSNARTTARTPNRRRDPAAGRNPARDARPGHRPAQKTARKRDHATGR